MYVMVSVKMKLLVGFTVLILAASAAPYRTREYAKYTDIAHERLMKMIMDELTATYTSTGSVSKLTW